MTPHPKPPTPGDVLLHPLALLALALWLLNDHLLKALWSNGLTGKLSDVAALIAFPLIAVAWVEVAARLVERTRWSRVSRTAVIIAASLTASVMVLINVTEAGAWAYQHGLGLLQWPFFVVAALWEGRATPAPGLVDLTMDPYDVLTVPAALVPVWIVWRARPARGEAPSSAPLIVDTREARP